VPAVRLTIPLSDASSDTLRRLASREYRDPRMQAKLLLEEALRNRADALQADDREPVGATLATSPLLGEQT
jgi:hypothetical protein